MFIASRATRTGSDGTESPSTTHAFDAAALPEALRSRETPSPRKPLEQIISEGRFSLTSL